MYKKTEPGGDNEDMYHYRGVVNSYLGMLKHVNSYKERLKFARNRPHLYFDKDITKMQLLGFTQEQLKWFKNLKR